MHSTMQTIELTPDFKEFIESFNRHGVEYALIGGYAVAYHGWPRATKYIVFFVDDSRENLDRVMKALAEFFGTTVDPQTTEDFYRGNSFLVLGQEPNRIDILKNIQGVRFKDIARISALIDGILVPVIDYDSLLKNKRAAGRDQDLVDVRKLEQRRSKKL